MNKQLTHAQFERISSIQGDQVAIESVNTKLKYSELNAYANQIANALLENGLEKGNIVAAVFEKSPEYVASILGINKAGGAFMPLELDFPATRKIALLNAVQPSFVVTHEDSLSAMIRLFTDPELSPSVKYILTVDLKCAEPSIQVYDLEGTLISNVKHNDEDIHLELDGNDTNYIIYTSGSTGKPKIIEGCHKGLSHFIHWEINEFKLDNEVRVSQLAPLSFDVSLRDIFVPLLAGGTLCIPEKETGVRANELIEWLLESKITFIHCVPTLFRLLIEELKMLPHPKKAVEFLQYILLAGEPLFGKDVISWRSIVGEDTQLVNMYGPSETTLAKMFHRITTVDSNLAAIVPLGKAISNTAVLIIMEKKLCQIGEVGDIYIKTPFRSKGYFNNAEMTVKFFIQNPLHHEFEDIVYFTGDLGKYSEDMDVLFMGRTDHQIKLRGNRVELLEVEKVLVSFQGINNVAVIVANEEQDAFLACYYTGEKINEAVLKSFLDNCLPTYMHPSYYHQLKDFPLNDSGKIDRKSLPKPEFTGIVGYEPPINEIEMQLEMMWSEILKIPKVSRNDSFFNLGGTSLKCIKIISRIYKEYNIKIKLAELFINPTISQLGMLLEREQKLI